MDRVAERCLPGERFPGAVAPVMSTCVTTTGRGKPTERCTWAGRGPRRPRSCTPRVPPLPASASRASVEAWRMACAILFRQASFIPHHRQLSGCHNCCTLPIRTKVRTRRPPASAAAAAASRRREVSPTRAAPRQPSPRRACFHPGSTRIRRARRPGSRTCTREGERSGTESPLVFRHRRSRAPRSPGTCRTSLSAGRWCTWSDA